jgi:response regulator RpfG family c-di-GMP phosphodiesterase
MSDAPQIPALTAKELRAFTRNEARADVIEAQLRLLTKNEREALAVLASLIARLIVARSKDHGDAIPRVQWTSSLFRSLTISGMLDKLEALAPDG